jgi:hydrogenase maturation protein HypF
VGVLFETLDSALPQSLAGSSRNELRLFGRMLSSGINSPITTSAGRLFDAAASLAGLAHRTSFEGQAAMALEHAIGDASCTDAYGFRIIDNTDCGSHVPHVVDWVPGIRRMLSDIDANRPVAHIAAAFHNGLIESIVDVAQLIGEPRVVLTGGCFQNRHLTEHAVAALRAAGFEPYWHRWLPPNDGGLAVGQAEWAARLIERETSPCA